MQTRSAPDYASVFSVLADLVEIGIVVAGPEGGLDFASKKARELLGCAERVRLGACHPEAERTIRELVAEFKEGNVRSVQKEVHITTDDGARRISMTIHPLEEEDCNGFLIEVKDAEIMHRMATDLRMAAQFRNTRRLYQALVEDLKQPISAVMLHTDLLRESMIPEDDQGEVPREARSFDTIRRQITELNRALTLLLEEIDPSDTREQGFSLQEVLQDIVRFVEPQALLQNIEIERCDDGHPARLTGSRQRLKQAILNLAVNALDAMPDGGRLTFDLSVRDDRATLTIGDTGDGIDDQVLPHIFEMHFTTKQSGTGVGLYVAREVIGNHGGAIQVVSSTGECGTTFAVTLPVHQSVL